MMRAFFKQLQQFVGHSKSRSITAGLFIILVAFLGLTTAAGAIDPFGVVKIAQDPAGALAPTSAVPGPDLRRTSTDRLHPAGLAEPGKKPQTGWLYVVDSNNRMDEAQILLLDPRSQEVKGAFRTGHAPDMALAPDGSRLYVASSRGSSSILEVFDTTSGATVQTVDVPYRGISPDPLLVSGLAISPDGQWLYIYKMHTIAPGNDEYMVSVFDIASGKLRSTDIPAPGCSQALFVPMRENMRFLCLPSNDLRVITNGTKTIASSMALPLASEAQNRDTPEYAVGGVASANGRSVYIATDTGRIWNTDDSLSQITRTIDLGLPAEMGAALGALAISPDGATLYIGIGQRDSQSVLVPADRIAIVDTASGKQIGTITLSQLFRSFTISADGHYLYAIARDRQSVFVIDTTTQRQVDVIKEVGTPIRFIAVAP